MPWNQITVDVPHDLLDTIAGELGESGVCGVWETVAPERGATRLVVYCDSAAGTQDAESRIKAVFEREHLDPPDLARDAVIECDWTGEWKKTWTSFPIGAGFFVIPSWSGDVCPVGRQAIRIDPGQAFGTGTHETTQLTLEALEQRLRPGDFVLDVGTGSGILAIAAQFSGAGEVFACDVDPDAVNVAGENFQRNIPHFSARMFCGSIDAVRGESVDMALCNLTADVIQKIIPDLYRVVRPGGLAILSGILAEQGSSIRDICHRFYFTVHEETARGEWLGFVVQKDGS